MKITKIVALISICFSLSACGSSPVLAYSRSDGTLRGTEDIAWNEYDPLSWNQFNAKDMPQSYLGSQMLDGASGVSFPEGGDLIYVYTFLAIKTGHKMAGYIPSFANADLERYHAYANGIAHLGAEGIWSNGWHADLEPNGSQLQKNVTLDSARNAFRNGKLVVLQVKNDNFTEETPYTHFIAIDSVENDNTVKIFDSYKLGAQFSDSYKSSDIVGMITLSSDKVKSTDLPKLWQRRGFKDVFSANNERDPATLGGGGGINSKAIDKEPLPSANSENNSLGKYVPRDDAPEKIEKGSKVKNYKQNSGSGLNVWNILAAILGISISIGGFIFIWLRKRNLDT